MNGWITPPLTVSMIIYTYTCEPWDFVYNGMVLVRLSFVPSNVPAYGSGGAFAAQMIFFRSSLLVSLSIWTLCSSSLVYCCLFFLDFAALSLFFTDLWSSFVTLLPLLPPSEDLSVLFFLRPDCRVPAFFPEFFCFLVSDRLVVIFCPSEVDGYLSWRGPSFRGSTLPDMMIWGPWPRRCCMPVCISLAHISMHWATLRVLSPDFGAASPIVVPEICCATTASNTFPRGTSLHDTQHHVHGK